MPQCTFLVVNRKGNAKPCPNEGTTYAVHGLDAHYQRVTRAQQMAVAVCKDCARVVATRERDIDGRDVTREVRAAKKRESDERRERERIEHEQRERRRNAAAQARIVDAFFPFVGAVRDTLADLGINGEKESDDE